MSSISPSCQLKNKCTECNYEQDHLLCFGYRFMHGADGKTGVWTMTNVPKIYRNLNILDLPNILPNVTKDRIVQYHSNILEYVGKGVGIFMHSEPTTDNPLGVGNGKTTAAAILLNEYLRESTYKELQQNTHYSEYVPFFLSFAEFQNNYNGMFRGFELETRKCSTKFASQKHRAKYSKMVVLDDMALRNCTDAFINELYEIIDHRASHRLCTIITSNLSIEGLQSLYGARVTSRICSMSKPLVFRDKDHRQLNWE